MRQLFSLRLIITFAFLNCASYTSFAAVNPVTVTYQGGTSSFSVGDTLGTANYVVAVSPNVRPNNVPLNFSLKTSNSSSGLSAVQQLSYPSPCSAVSTVCGNTFALKAGESCCLAFSLNANQTGTYTMQPTISTTPPAFSAQAPEPLTITGTITIIPTISVSPSSLSLTEGGFSSCVSVTNLSSATIFNLNAVINTGSTNVTTTSTGTTCSSTLAANNSCNYCFLPGNQPGTATVAISSEITPTPVNVPITVSPATISVSPSSLTLLQGGFSGCVTVTNLSSNGTIINLNQTLSQGTTQATLDTFSTTCASSLPASGQCNYCFLPGIQEGTALSTIAANNIASPVNVPITVSAANPTTITVPATAVIPVYATSGTPLSLTVRNTGSYNAFNVHADLSNTGWSGVTQDATNCTDIPANGGTCTLYFRSTAPYLAKGGLTVTGDNLTAPAPIAFAFSINTYLIFALNSPASILPQVIDVQIFSGIYDSVTTSTNATSFTNGLANTSALYTLYAANTPAGVCYASTAGSASLGTWYLPAICQMGGTGQGANCSNDNTTTLDNLVQLGFFLYNSTPFWSSTQYNSTFFWGEAFQASTQAGYILSDNLQYSCARSVSIP